MRLFLSPSRLVEGNKEVRLGHKATLIMLAAGFNHTITREEMMEIIWPHPDDMPDWWLGVMRVTVWNLNQKLRKLGWELAVLRAAGGWELRRTQPQELAKAA